MIGSISGSWPSRATSNRKPSEWPASATQSSVRARDSSFGIEGSALRIVM